MKAHAGDWSRLLIDRLDDELAAAEARALPANSGLMGSAHAIHGVEILIHIAGIDRASVTDYLIRLADAVECEDDHLPMLVSLACARS